MGIHEDSPPALVLDLPVEAPPWVALDTETSGLHADDHARVACVSVTWPVFDGTGDLATRAFPFDQGPRDKFPTQQLEFDFTDHTHDPNLTGDEWRGLLDWLTKQQLIVYHNAKFDITMMREGTRHWRGVDLIDVPFWDTMLTQRVLDPTEKAALDATVQRLGLGAKQGLDAIKVWLKRNKFPATRYDLAPWSIVEPYVTADTEMTAALYMHQQYRLATGIDLYDPELARAKVQREFDLMRSLYEMERRGISYDALQSVKAAEELERMALEIEKVMPFPATPAGGKAYFYGKLRLQADRVSDKTGAPSLDEEQVRKFANEDVPWAREYAQVTKYRTAVSMWYRGYPEKIGVDGRLRTSFRQGHVKSGRMSVERVQLQAIPKKDKNIQGIPGVREFIFAEEGKGLWNIDLSQAELRVATRYSRCERMSELINNGGDAHSETTKGVLGVSPDDPLWKEKRDIAKRLNFGGIFQIGGKTFQATLSKLADIHLPLEECYQYVTRWRGMYPEFGVAYRKAEQTVIGRGWVRLLPNTNFEIRSYFGELDFPNTGWNRIVQGSLAEAFGIWLAEIEKRWPGYMVLTIHDSVVLEAPLDEGQQIAVEIGAFGSELMTDLFRTPMNVDIDRW